MAERKPIKILEVPVDCQSCKASCPMKVNGCAFDQVMESMMMTEALEARGIQVSEDGLGAFIAKADVEAKACRTGITEKVKEHNMYARVSQMVAQSLGLSVEVVEEAQRAPQMIKLADIMPEAQKDLPVVRDIETNGHNGHANGHQQAVMEVKVVPKKAAKKTVAKVEAQPKAQAKAASDDLYYRANDKTREQDIKNMEDDDIHAICVVPKVNVDNLQAYEAKVPSMFEKEPFDGVLAVIPKRHEGNPKLLSIHVYYRGPPQEKAREILRQRKAEAAQATA